MNSSKNSIIVKIVLLSILTVVLLGVMMFFLTSKWFFRKFDFNFGSVDKYKLVLTETYNVSEISKFDFSLRDADLSVKYSDSNEVKLEIYDKDEKRVTTNLSDGVLSVNFDNYSSVCIGFCFDYRRVVLYVPKDYNNIMSFSSASGDITVENFVDSNVSVSTASGDVKLLGALKGDVNTASGEVTVRDISTLNVKTISGDIYIRNVSDLKGSSTSGDVEVRGIGNSINFKTTSGDIDLERVILKQNSKLSSVSGDIDVSNINQVYVNTSTVSGDVDVLNSDRKSDIELSIKTTSGDIDVE